MNVKIKMITLFILITAFVPKIVVSLSTDTVKAFSNLFIQVMQNPHP